MMKWSEIIAGPRWCPRMVSTNYDTSKDIAHNEYSK